MLSGNAVGQTLDDKYKIERQLGKGGMGTVYLATHLGTERPVALKIIASEFMKRAEFVERFRREARAAGRLRHPNVVDVTDFGFSKTANGDVAYLVMEYLDGCTLGEVLKEEKNLPLSWTVDILEQVCSAVHEAHQQGIIHRDLKPDNIWLEPNQRGGYTVKVLDFGIAKLDENHVVFSDIPAAISNEGSATRLIGSDTVSNDDNSKTITDQNSATIAGESSTMAFGDATGIVESGTEAVAPVGDLEEADEAGQTKLMPDTGNAATKLIPDQKFSEEPENSAVSTSKPALRIHSTSELTRIGAVLGTPLYMSPEQCRGEKLTARSDIYSLGVIAYQMLSGDTPFTGDYSAVMESHKESNPPMLDSKKVPKKVKHVINASLAKCIEDRPQTAEGFASELRASSEGLGQLLRRALVIYSQHIPKFLQIAFLLALPPIFLMIANVVLRFLTAIEFLPETTVVIFANGAVSLAYFFAQIFYAAMVVGMTTWIVAQVLAAPLRPISVKATFKQIAKRWKPLALTVTASTLISLFSWIVGAIAGAIISLLVSGPIYYFTQNEGWLIGFAIGFAIIGAVVLGVLASARFMLIAPSIMMEAVRGRAAFRRSAELGKRSFRTVFATAVLIYVFPLLLASLIALFLNGMMNTFDPPKTAAEAVVVETEAGKTAEPKPAEDNDLIWKVDGKGVRLTTQQQENSVNQSAEDTEKSMAKKFRGSLQQGLYELLWLPISVLIISFTSVITALLYFKTRQAGGESMQELLLQFEEDEGAKSNWQTRVRERLLQSGRTTTGKKFITN